MLDKNTLDSFTPWLISVCQTGSTTIPWINDPHDIDYAFFVKDIEDGEMSSKLFALRPADECWLGEAETPKCTFFSYEYHFMKLLYGDKMISYDIFEHVAELKAALVKKARALAKTPLKKTWYHFLTNIYLLENGDYELTEKQIEKVRQLHNWQMSQQTFEFIKSTLTKWEEEGI